MDLMQAIFLGAIQGIGEFLPISSSAHLVLTPWLFGWTDPGLSFDVALHFGTLVAVLLYFWRDWIAIAGAGLGFQKQTAGFAEIAYPKYLLWALILGTVPGALAGYFLEHYAEREFRNPLLIAATLSLMGFLLFWADRRLRNTRDMGHVTGRDALLIGIAQALAIVPGISRSGATITAALLMGIDRVSAARFSFLLSTPIIFGASAMKVNGFLHAGAGWMELAGILTAAVTGYLSIAALIGLVNRVSYKVFFWYRLALALLIVSLWLLR
ncbi:MAG: undecaprenyl-diphosphate phosphatase [Syntrophobacteraceae bacterium]|nr:undecaprenyl-diphosphate phosphatase [Desulfobacteraceae bacterium]